MAIAIVLPGFKDRGSSVTPNTDFSYNYLHIAQKLPKTNVESSRDGIPPSCGFKAREIMAARCELFL